MRPLEARVTFATLPQLSDLKREFYEHWQNQAQSPLVEVRFRVAAARLRARIAQCLRNLEIHHFFGTRFGHFDWFKSKQGIDRDT